MHVQAVVSPSTRRAWIEIDREQRPFAIAGSPSTRRAWIEISPLRQKVTPLSVALHPEGVDRNSIAVYSCSVMLAVALHPEGVDRNICKISANTTNGKSPSTRRAWIEIFASRTGISRPAVALHPEGVDRNRTSTIFRLTPNDVALHPEGAGRTQIVTLDFWTRHAPKSANRVKDAPGIKTADSSKSAFIGCEKRRMRAFFCR